MATECYLWQTEDTCLIVVLYTHKMCGNSEIYQRGKYFSPIVYDWIILTNQVAYDDNKDVIKCNILRLFTDLKIKCFLDWLLSHVKMYNNSMSISWKPDDDLIVFSNEWAFAEPITSKNIAWAYLCLINIAYDYDT